MCRQHYHCCLAELSLHGTLPLCSSLQPLSPHPQFLFGWTTHTSTLRVLLNSAVLRMLRDAEACEYMQLRKFCCCRCYYCPCCCRCAWSTCQAAKPDSPNQPKLLRPGHPSRRTPCYCSGCPTNDLCAPTTTAPCHRAPTAHGVFHTPHPTC